MLYEMRLVGLAMDPFSNSPIVILKDRASVEAEERKQGTEADLLLEDDEGGGMEIEVELDFCDDENNQSLDDENNQSLDVKSQEHILPIWIGESEANAIATELLGIVPSRPMTHDLIKEIITSLGGEIHRIVVTDLQENTFYAVIEVFIETGEILSIDSRPSDALALALRCKADIFVEEKVIEQTLKNDGVVLPTESTMHHSQKEKWKDVLENLKSGSLNKYKQ